MSRKKTVEYKHGSRFQVYINSGVDDDILNFINKQSDLTGATMLGFIFLRQIYGNVDLNDYLPRHYRKSSVSIEDIFKLLQDNHSIPSHLLNQVEKSINTPYSPPQQTPIKTSVDQQKNFFKESLEEQENNDNLETANEKWTEHNLETETTKVSEKDQELEFTNEENPTNSSENNRYANIPTESFNFIKQYAPKPPEK